MTRFRQRLQSLNHRVPARWRIVGWLLVTAGISMLLLLVTFRGALEARAAVQANEAVEQELGEFRQFAEQGRDPETARQFNDPFRLVDVFLSRQRPGLGEVMLGVNHTTGQIIDVRGPGTPELVDTGLVVDGRVSEAVTAQQSGVITTQAGIIRFARMTVESDGGGSASVVVAVLMDAQSNAVTGTMRLLTAVTLVALGLTAFVAWVVAGRILRPVQTATETAAEITERDWSRRLPVIGDDEFARLARTFNAMLDRLESAFAMEQRFVDDAGHELRTPITIIRGHLELMGDDPLEQQATLALVTQELDRMGRIVADLLTLAKAEHPDYIQLGDPVDLGPFTLDLDAQVSAMADRFWTMVEVADGSAIIDGQRITQAVLQLATNAVQHTELGDEIRLASRFVTETDGTEWAEFEVADHGPGVPESERETIFQRFTRGSDVQRDAAGGAGLGLSIVSAIAAGHQGTVRVEETPGGGATFIIRVPRRMTGVEAPDEWSWERDSGEGSVLEEVGSLTEEAPQEVTR